MSMRLLPLLLSLFFVLRSAKAATHVNISIGHQSATNPADVTYVDGKAPAELRAGPFNTKQHQSDFAYRVDGNNDGNAKLRDSSDQIGNFEYAHESARLTAGGDGARMEFNGGRQLSNRQQQSGYSARLREQNRQNQEFERYIQNYHSGPTVETVFETATPSSSSQRQKSQSSSSSSSSSSFSTSSSNGGQSQRLVAIGSRPSHMHTFERQVALPTGSPSATLLPPSDERQTHTIVNHQPKVVSVDAGLSSSSSGFDQSNSFDPAGSSFNKPSFTYDDSDLHSQYPPLVDESQVNFGGNGGNGFYAGNEQPTHFSGSTPAPGYLPSYPRPLVTKTIQIAQPALKAKKYEIRHPAVQKEFYDIEERVVIKPAGTIVVELERPVAKIPKGEAVLPLGHPHPAVASAYHTNGAAIVQTMGSDVLSNGNNNQYSPSPVYNSKGTESQYPLHPSPAIASTTLGSTVTTTPSYDTDSKDDFVESNLNKQYNSDAQYVTTTERSYADEKQNNDGFFVTTTESNRNYGSQFYGRDETDRSDRRHPSQVVGHIEVKNNGAPGVSTAYSTGNRQYNNFGSYGSAAAAPQYQPNFNDNNQFKGEFLSGEFYNHQQGPKPARLQEAPRMRGSAISGPTSNVIKHEHNIHLPASQHNIFLGRLEQEPTPVYGRSEQKAQLRSGPRFNQEAAEVLELKPYLKHHPGSVVVYASSKARPSFNGHYTQSPSYDYARYARPNEQRQQFYAVNNQVKYSAPYTNMRYYSDQSPRYVYGSEPNYRDKSNLVAESTAANTNVDNDGYQSDSPSKTITTASQPHAHIQIQIPHHPKEVAKPIVVTSTISPVVHNVGEEINANYRHQTTSDRGDFDVDRFGLSGEYQRSQGEYRNANFEDSQSGDFTKQKSLRLVDSGSVGESTSSSSASSISHNIGGLQPGSVDLNLKSTAGHVATPGSRVIAATPAPTDAAASSESFHKRRIVVNHPFQTVREVVEHEPITNYHHIQVNEPASPELYHHTAPYYQQETHGALRQMETLPVVYHHHSAQTHGNLNYAPILPLVHGVTVGYHHHG